MPQILPTVAPQPAPTSPLFGAFASAFTQASYPMSASGRTSALP